MGRFIGLSKNKGSGHQLEDPNTLNSGLVLTSNGTGFVLAGGASLDRDPLPDFVNANETLNTTLSVTGAFGDSVYTFAWRDGAQYGLSISSSGTLTGAASSMIALSVLKLDITDTKYNKVYEVDVEINVSTSNGYPAITLNNSSVEIFDGNIQFAATGSPTEWSITNLGNLASASGVTPTLTNGGLLNWAGPPSPSTNTYNFTLGVRNASMPAGVYRTQAFSKQVQFSVVLGQQQYTGAYGQNGGQCSYSWTAPSGVTKVHVMAGGAGGGGNYQWAVCGGHGGGRVWANNIPVNPGQAYCIQVGRAGCWNSTTGGCSCWPGMNACGGCCGCYGGCYSISAVTDGTGTCCGSYGMIAYPGTAGGGGGAAGYCGAAPANSTTSNYCGCGGGGGSGTSHHSSTHGTGGGGGTGACGMCCYATSPASCGYCSNAGYSHQTGAGGQGGSGGTCGKPGEPWSNGNQNGHSCGGCYGGGGGGGGTGNAGGWGGPGVVRILWGDSRCWPCCNTHNL